MKIIVLYGDDERKLFPRLKKFIETARTRSWEVINLDDPAQNLIESLQGISLFGSERFFVLRDIRRLGKKELDWLKKKSSELSGNLIIYHEGQLPVSLLKGLSKETKIEEYKLPVLIWNFLDGLIPGSAAKSLALFHRIIEKEAPEFIFSQIARHFRDLYWAKTDSATMSYQPWRISKLKAQSSKFSDGKLREFLSKLAQIDIEVKTGKAELVSSLDLLMLKQLE